MSARDGNEWRPIPWSRTIKCCEDDCQEFARWEEVLFACDKSCYHGGDYCDKHASDNGNLMTQEHQGGVDKKLDINAVLDFLRDNDIRQIEIDLDEHPCWARITEKNGAQTVVNKSERGWTNRILDALG